MKFRLLLFLLIFTACSSQPVVEEQVSSDEPQASPQQAAEQKKADNWAWSYQEGARGPKNWANINPDYKLCEQGQMQSPINLVWHKPASANPLRMNYKGGMAKQVQTDHTIRLDLTPQSSISFKGHEYLLEKIEIRSPSEHTLSGNQLPMELQFYHRTSNGLKQAVISLFVVYGKGSSWFDQLWGNLENSKQNMTLASFPINPDQMIPPRKTYYNYQGSLTHPPCLEGVEWLVFNTPLQLSKEQVAKFQSHFGKNNRPIQPTNDRPITNY